MSHTDSNPVASLCGIVSGRPALCPAGGARRRSRQGCSSRFHSTWVSRLAACDGEDCAAVLVQREVWVSAETNSWRKET